MKKIVTVQQAIQIAEKLHKETKHIVLVGGCFDILHIGHITFLQKAKAAGDSLFVFLESDESITKLKGKKRPINNQEDRAKILGALESVDYVILLPPRLADTDYDRMIIQIKPAIIAITSGDPYKKQKKRQAALIDSRMIEATDFISDQSTSRLVKFLGKKL
ncbi:adenylyltransferase/cytidyltransferase family protein [Patescibacteria group bacterium]|nr:adenylyltransferase/cytidyltransferase family protein [Patescibacteria group bacterium]MBU4017428.1 adenylyltransferase/cytidyltransferase family protein [Patescibacteria group bacterium]MBU4098418.1 adenylyltransferase/cytidyltransferase family protein [Patescibacteria group bacterium]